jgi:hypothetical protein
VRFEDFSMGGEDIDNFINPKDKGMKCGGEWYSRC